MKKTLHPLFQPIDLTQGSCWKTILIFSIPIIISYLLQQVYTISDAAIVGQTLAAAEVAGVNDTAPLVFIFLQFAFGVSAGFCVGTDVLLIGNDKGRVAGRIAHLEGARVEILVFDGVKEIHAADLLKRGI